jgi:hypothetical protein
MVHGRGAWRGMRNPANGWGEACRWPTMSPPKAHGDAGEMAFRCHYDGQLVRLAGF